MSDHHAQDLLDAVREQAHRLLREQVQADTIETLLDTPGSWDQALWNQVAAQGWSAVALDESQGGTGLGCNGLAVMAEELGRSGAALPLWQTALAAMTLQEAPTADPDPAPWLASLAAGTATACLAWTGPATGQLHGSAALTAQGHTLTGQASTIAFAASADCALAIAQDEHGQDSVWLVPLAPPTVDRQTVHTLDNARAHATLRFQQTPAFPLGGAPSAAQLIDRAATLTAFEQVGSAQAGLARTIEYALQREAFGQPIAKFQSIKHKLVDIYSAIEIARGCMLTALERLDDTDPEERRQAVAAARVAASQADEQSARDSINTFGALGVTREAAPHRHYRRARSLALELGSTIVWREALVATFLKRHLRQEA